MTKPLSVKTHPGDLHARLKHNRNKWPYLVLSFFILFFFNMIGNQRTIAYVYLAGRYHQVQRNLIKIKYIFDSYDFGAGKPKIVTKSMTSPIDGMTMVYIPAGNFLMGEDRSPAKVAPQHVVYLGAYWIDQTEVTNRMYALCVKSGACWLPIQSEGVNPYYDNPRYSDYPVVYINWDEAARYCAWANRRLPTEAEWEKAARGTDGRRYPWGHEKPNSKLLNFQDNIGTPLPVDRYPSGASPYGILNMAGNVREWVADWYDNRAYEEDHYLNPLGPESGVVRSLRGGHFSDSWQQVSTYNRFSHEPQSAGLARGFRCAADD
jgi:formylglycine-generating enzyme required for sulfatase activity